MDADALLRRIDLEGEFSDQAHASPAATRVLAGRIAAAIVAAVADHTLGRASLVAAAAAVLRARHVSLCG